VTLKNTGLIPGIANRKLLSTDGTCSPSKNILHAENRRYFWKTTRQLTSSSPPKKNERKNDKEIKNEKNEICSWNSRKVVVTLSVIKVGFHFLISTTMHRAAS